MNSPNNERRVDDGPSQNEGVWLTYAITAACLTVAGTLIAAIWIFCIGAMPVSAAARVRVLTPFGTLAIALVTFCTVIWRGMVASRQADEQRKANEQKDEELLAKLLMDGAKLLEATTEKNVALAGIAAMHAVTSSAKTRYGKPALEILANYITKNSDDKEIIFPWMAAVQAFNEGIESGHTTDMFIILQSSDENRQWPAIKARFLRCTGGTFIGLEFKKLVFPATYSFHSVRFLGCTIPDNLMHDQCRFVSCKIQVLTATTVETNTFQACDFSGAYITQGVITNDEQRNILLASNSYYNEGHPPRSDIPFDWSQLFSVQKPKRK